MQTQNGKIGPKTDRLDGGGGVDSNPRCREGSLWAQFGPSLAHYSARRNASVLERICSPGNRLCFGPLRSPARSPMLGDVGHDRARPSICGTTALAAER